MMGRESYLSHFRLAGKENLPNITFYLVYGTVMGLSRDSRFDY